jgi:transcriptional antiterminator NusG
VGDFVGAGGKPVPMTADDIAKMTGRQEKVAEEKQPRLQINFEKGDRVKIKEGAFENFEGEVDEVIESKGLVRVMVNVFNRPTPVELEYWQVETV